MSIQAITVEEITIHNVNPDTSRIAELFGRYLTETWGIDYLKLTVDDKTYETEEDKILEGTELYDVCRNLSAYKEIKASLNSDNGGGIDWRRESMFLKELKNVPSLTENVVYTSVDEYDEDPGVDLCGFGKDGLTVPNREGNTTFEGIRDIKEWYAYSPEVHIMSNSEKGNEALYQRLRDAFYRFADILGYDHEDFVMDEWMECGEMCLDHSISFGSDMIPKMLEAIQDIYATASECATDDPNDIQIDLCAKPVGEGDYPFATVSFVLDEDGVSVKYGRV